MNRQKVFLVQATKYGRALDRSMPLGLMYLASFVRSRNDCEVRLFDMQLGVKTIEPVLTRANEFQPNVVGISGMTRDLEVIRELAHRLRVILPSVHIVVGGPHASLSPEDIITIPAVDFVIAGEGEVGFGVLMEHIAGKIDIEDVPNLVFLKDGIPKRNRIAPFIADLNSLPFPAYDLIDLKRYWCMSRVGLIYSNKRYATLMTSRGCPFHCAYCHNIHGKQFRYRDPENVMDEIEWLIRDFGVREFVFMDDVFNFIPSRINRLAELIINRSLDIALHLPTGIRPDIMTEESVKLLKGAGLFRCGFGIDTGSQRIQELTGRNMNLERTLRTIEMTSSQGILTHGSFMLGFPTEIEEEARETIDFAVRSKLHTAAFHRAIPFHGTELYRLVREQGLELPAEDELFDFNKDSTEINASAIPDQVLVRIRRRAYRRFYLSFSRTWKLIRLMPNKWSLLPMLVRFWVRKAITS